MVFRTLSFCYSPDNLTHLVYVPKHNANRWPPGTTALGSFIMTKVVLGYHLLAILSNHSTVGRHYLQSSIIHRRTRSRCSLSGGVHCTPQMRRIDCRMPPRIPLSKYAAGCYEGVFRPDPSARGQPPKLVRANGHGDVHEVSLLLLQLK